MLQQPANAEPGPKGNATISQDISNPTRDPKHFADPSGATMKALCWEGKNKVAVRKSAMFRTIAKGANSPDR
jgi:hypothetical protein